jgi:signal transduction histidine kinase
LTRRTATVAALGSLIGRAPVPVLLDVDLDTRPPSSVETAAYFVVTEALTNVAKHAHATLVTVAVSADADRLLVQVRDDGRGGAHLGKGHGLAGLADRLATVEGVLDVHSPDGGPTVLTAEIPLRGLA